MPCYKVFGYTTIEYLATFCICISVMVGMIRVKLWKVHHIIQLSHSLKNTIQFDDNQQHTIIINLEILEDPGLHLCLV